jgi:hypothetical protein
MHRREETNSSQRLAQACHVQKQRRRCRQNLNRSVEPNCLPQQKNGIRMSPGRVQCREQETRRMVLLFLVGYLLLASLPCGLERSESALGKLRRDRINWEINVPVNSSVDEKKHRYQRKTCIICLSVLIGL